MQVAEVLIAEIDHGTYKVGQLMPSEMEIAQHFGLSRHTTREALRVLEDMGLITRRAGVGTMVKAKSAQSHYTAALGDLSDLVHHTKHTQLQVIGEDWIESGKEFPGIDEDSQVKQWLRLKALRLPATQGPVISYTEILLHPLYEKIRERISEAGITVFRLIEEQDGERIKELRQEVDCVALDEATAQLLQCQPGDPALRVYRYYYGRGDTLLSVSSNLYPQGRFKITTKWRLDSQRAAL